MALSEAQVAPQVIFKFKFKFCFYSFAPFSLPLTLRRTASAMEPAESPTMALGESALPSLSAKLDSVVPAERHTKLYGNRPKRTLHQNSPRRTPECGAAMFSAQFGVKGKSRAVQSQIKRLDACLSRETALRTLSRWARAVADASLMVSEPTNCDMR